MTHEHVLKATGISKDFPGVKALDRVDFELLPGEVHALVGENGAGKSTLMNILSGVLQPDFGEVFIGNRKMEFKDPHAAAQAGIGIVFQELSLIQNLSVAENIFPGRQKTNLVGFIDFPDLHARTRKLLDDFGETLDPKTPVKYLSIAKQQVVEILKALSHEPKILILDEPTSSLTHHEIKLLFNHIRQLKLNGIGIIYISHHLQEIFEIADRATVLRDGCTIATVRMEDSDEARIASLMVGREIIHHHVMREDKIDRHKPVLQVRNLSHKKYFRDISFDLFAGEIVGMAGLIGAGRSEIARTLFGLERKTKGEVLLDGRSIDPRSPTEALACGLAYTSENRKLDGLFLDMSISENSIAPQLKRFSGHALDFLDNTRIAGFVKENMGRFAIRASSAEAKVRKLSGGNQQKVLLSMWLGIGPKVLIVDEPTKGVDVGAKNEILDILRRIADSGIPIMVISSDLLEILALCDRVLVLKEGRIRGELNHAEATEEKIIAYASGIV